MRNHRGHSRGSMPYGQSNGKRLFQFFLLIAATFAGAFVYECVQCVIYLTRHL